MLRPHQLVRPAMVRLSHKDIRSLFEGTVRLHASRQWPDLFEQVVTLLPSLVGTDLSSLFDIEFPSLRERVLARNLADSQGDRCFSQAGEFISQEYIGQHMVKTGDISTRFRTDVATDRDCATLDYYDVLFSGGFHWQAGLGIRAVPGVAHGICLTRCRDRKDFTERDRLLLNLLRPHLVQAFQTVYTITDLRSQLAARDLAVETLHYGLVGLTVPGAIRWSTKVGRRLLEHYCVPSLRRPDRLPDWIAAWVKEQRRQLADPKRIPAPLAPLSIPHNGRALELRFIEDADGGLLFLHERVTELSAAVLLPLGLTRREAEVLTWLASGKTNHEIAAILGVRARTIDKHLENIYAKLGVENRTAAVALVHERHRYHSH
jgi:DNA-binding CsgD family transcriptional regulator